MVKNMAETELITVVLLIVAIVLVTLFLYLAGRLVAGKKRMETGYLIRLLVIAVVAVLALPILISIIASLDRIGLRMDNKELTLAGLLGLSQLIPVIFYLGLVYLIRFLMLTERPDGVRLSNSLWIAFVTLMLIFGFNALTQFLFGQNLIQAFS